MPFKTAEQAKGGTVFCGYGDSGFGKTLLGAAFAEVMMDRTGKPVAYADWDFGEASIPTASLPSMRIWQPGSEEMGATNESFEILEATQSDAYSGLVVDTTSTMGSSVLSEITQQNIKADKSQDTQRMGFNTGKYMISAPGKPDYGLGYAWFKRWYIAHKGILARKKHVLWLAHSKTAEIRDAQDRLVEVIGGPSILGAAATRDVPKYSTVLLRLTCVKAGSGVRRIIQTDIDGLFQARDRLRCLNPNGEVYGIDLVKGMSGEDFSTAIVSRGKEIWKAVFDAFDKK